MRACGEADDSLGGDWSYHAAGCALFTVADRELPEATEGQGVFFEGQALDVGEDSVDCSLGLGLRQVELVSDGLDQVLFEGHGVGSFVVLWLALGMGSRLYGDKGMLLGVWCKGRLGFWAVRMGWWAFTKIAKALFLLKISLGVVDTHAYLVRIKNRAGGGSGNRPKISKII